MPTVIDGSTGVTMPAGGVANTAGAAVGTTDTQTLTNKTIQGGALTLATAQTASGSSVDFTGIPSWVKRITVMLSGVSTNGTSIVQIQLGDSGGFENTGYLGSSIQLIDANSVNAATSTTGFGIRTSLAANINSGAVVLTNLTGNTWSANGTLSDSTRGAGYVVAGAKTLSDTLTQVRITTVNGTDTFDAGTINIMYEG